MELEDKKSRNLMPGTQPHPAMQKLYGPYGSKLINEVHYQCCNQTLATLREGKYWFWHSIPQWVKTTGICHATLERHIAKLKRTGTLVVATYTRGPGNRTNWYRLNYQQLLQDLNGLHPDEETFTLRELPFPTFIPVLPPPPILPNILVTEDDHG